MKSLALPRSSTRLRTAVASLGSDSARPTDGSDSKYSCSDLRRIVTGSSIVTEMP